MSLNAGAIKRPARPPRASHPFPISTQCVCLLSLSPVPTTRAEAFWTRLDAPKQINIRGTHISHVSLCFFFVCPAVVLFFFAFVSCGVYLCFKPGFILSHTYNFNKPRRTHSTRRCTAGASLTFGR